MSMMERILRVMADKQASDVYLSANSPALIKIDGECMPVNSQILTPEALEFVATQLRAWRGPVPASPHCPPISPRKW